MGIISSKMNAEGTYDPSPFTNYMFTESTSKYKSQNPEERYTGTKPILVVATDEGLLTMENGKKFNTGNHPIEMLVPMLHFRDAGFTFDIATAHGNPVVLEMWAYPKKDKNVADIHKELKDMMENPKKIEDITNLDAYSAIFIPGGHGAMVNLPSNVALGKLLNIAHERSLPTVTLCHGPAVLLSTQLEGTGKTENAYKGYKIFCFTDKTDAFTPSIGYLPGKMPWKVQQSLEAQGIEIVNKSEVGGAMVDRELITGDSPQAAHNFGVMAAPLLTKHAMKYSM